MATNYASKFQKTVDEVFRLESVTPNIINKGIRLDYLGVNAVSIYGVATVPEGNYQRNGKDRFGSLVELDTTKETFTLSQDKSFTFSIDRGNYEDQMMITEAGAALKRQIEVVCVPNTDIYRLSVLATYAITNSQLGTNDGVTLTSSSAYSNVLDLQEILDNKFVPAKGRVLYVPPHTLSLLKLDANFTKPSDSAFNKLVNGLVGEVDGVPIVKVPVSYLPSKVEMMLVHEEVLVAPHKFDTYRILKEVQGIDGWVVEGRRYYDALIPVNRGQALVVKRSA